MTLISEIVFTIIFLIFNSSFINPFKPNRCQRAAVPFLRAKPIPEVDICFPFDNPHLVHDPNPAHDDLDFFEFVAQKSGQSVPETTTKPSESTSTTSAPVIASSERPVVSETTRQKGGEETGNSVAKTEEEALIVFLLRDLFPDPFQAYIFSALLLWLAVALVLLRREWKKSSRIVVDVFLQQGPEAVQLVEDRYKDQLNLPEEYSLLA